jgi:DNA invertase Pin-like site-specific DNA recombinase
MKIGYIRVSKHEQNEALQVDTLQGAACEKLFRDVMTGVKFECKELDEALAYVRPADTFVVWKLEIPRSTFFRYVKGTKETSGSQA